MFEPQLNLRINEVQLDDDLLDISIQMFWDLARKNDKFISLILKLLKNDTCYHKSNLLIECEELKKFLYFQNLYYIFKSNILRFGII